MLSIYINKFWFDHDWLVCLRFYVSRAFGFFLVNTVKFPKCLFNTVTVIFWLYSYRILFLFAVAKTKDGYSIGNEKFAIRLTMKNHSSVFYMLWADLPMRSPSAKCAVPNAISFSLLFSHEIWCISMVPNAPEIGSCFSFFQHRISTNFYEIPQGSITAINLLSNLYKILLSVKLKYIDNNRVNHSISDN